MIMQLVMAKWKCKLGIYSESLMIEKNKNKNTHKELMMLLLMSLLYNDQNVLLLTFCFKALNFASNSVTKNTFSPNQRTFQLFPVQNFCPLTTILTNSVLSHENITFKIWRKKNILHIKLSFNSELWAKTLYYHTTNLVFNVIQSLEIYVDIT